MINPKLQAAYAALLALDPKDRGLVLCWFCPQCYKEIPPGEGCIHDDPECYFCGRKETNTFTVSLQEPK